MTFLNFHQRADLYMLNEDGEWVWVNAERPVINKKNCTSTVMTNMKRKWRDYMLFQPLYDPIIKKIRVKP